MTVYTTVPSGDRDPESPITPELIDALYFNPTAIAEGSSGAPALIRAANEVFTASGTFIARVTGVHLVTVIAGGQAGGNGASATFGGGGGARGDARSFALSLTAGVSYSLTIGGGGLHGSGSGAAGLIGNSSVFDGNTVTSNAYNNGGTSSTTTGENGEDVTPHGYGSDGTLTGDAVNAHGYGAGGGGGGAGGGTFYNGGNGAQGLIIVQW